jgi:hypothetical protein
MKAILLATTIFAGAFAGAAQAQTVAALVGGDTLVHVDAKAKKVLKTVKIMGAGPIVGIDVRPADGMLYGLASDGTIVTIDPASGKATMKSKLETMLPAGTIATVDFNPVADRLRVIGSNGMNLRANVDDGKVTTDGALKYAEADMSKGQTPNVVAGAYTHSFKGTKSTTLYDIDGTIGALLKQAPPNDGVLGTIGKLGVTGKAWAFDIASSEEGKNSAWLMSGDMLYSVDLESGKATPAGKVEGIKGAVSDIAILQ